MPEGPEGPEMPEGSGMALVSDPSPERRWFPVCRGGEAVPRHIVHTALLGQELAVWRADDGAVNAWENRCPHRGVRLSLGTNLGDRLKCRYHGWTYASGSGQCVERPAHPGETPPRIVRARRFGCVEAHGYVWVRLAGEGNDDPGPGSGPSPSPGFESGSPPPGLTLRSVHVWAPAAAVANALARHGGEGQEGSPAEAIDAFTVRGVHAEAGEIRYALQPMTDVETVIHAAIAGSPAAPERIAVLRRENARLCAVRDAIEASASP